MMLRRARSTSITATRSPIQCLFIISGAWAHTLKLYGRMKCFAIPSPKTASMNSPKFLASCGERTAPLPPWALISPEMHS